MTTTKTFDAIRLCTADVPAHDRIAMWREYYGRTVLRVEVEPHIGTDFACTLVSRVLPELQIVKAGMSPVFVARTSGLVADGDDKLTLVINLSGSIKVSGKGNESVLAAGDAVLMSGQEVWVFDRVRTGRSLGIRIPHDILSRAVPDVGNLFMRPLRRGDGALRLLSIYANSIFDEGGLGQPEVRSAVVGHIHDLVALTLGASAEAIDHAQNNGMPAARLTAAKAYITRNSNRPTIAIQEVAAALGISKRSLQLLFEKEATTFSAFLLSQRLSSAHRMLSDTKYKDNQIGSIAYEVGFSDLSYFNRSFKRRYGVSPRKMRAASLGTTR